MSGLLAFGSFSSFKFFFQSVLSLVFLCDGVEV